MFLQYLTQNEVKVLEYMIEQSRTKKQKTFKMAQVFGECGISYYPKANPFLSLQKKHFIRIMGNGQRNPNIILNINHIKHIEKKHRLILDELN